ncbi:MAG: response regulator [Nitrososphaeraceae archaeon]
MSNIFKDIMTEQGLDDGREGLHRTKNSEQLESNYIERMSSISSESRLKRRIMIIDDNSDIGLTLRMGLELGDKTMQVDCYDNPVTALTEFTPDFYDLLLIDINMPAMDGFELCQKLLQKDINVRVCFMTSGEINMEAVREVHPLKSIGCFIKKPITTDALARRIRAELE